MTNEEKAREIKANDVCCVWNGGCPNVYNAAMKMAEWKEQQMIERAVIWLSFNCDVFGYFKKGKLEYMLDKFQKAMEGGEKC